MGVGISTTDSHTVTAASSSEGDPVASGISQWRGRSPGQYDVTGVASDLKVQVSWGEGNWKGRIEHRGGEQYFPTHLAQ